LQSESILYQDGGKRLSCKVKGKGKVFSMTRFFVSASKVNAPKVNALSWGRVRQGAMPIIEGNPEMLRSLGGGYQQHFLVEIKDKCLPQDLQVHKRIPLMS
jgi:hypothetical protein